MFERPALIRLLSLHEKSYALFRWLNGTLKSGRQTLEKVSGALSFPDAAARWIRANASRLPEEHRPVPGDLDEFSHLFASYLSTSFEVGTNIRFNCPGCWCCGYWVTSKHLKARNPDRKAKERARKLKVIYLRQATEELRLPLLDPELEAFAKARPELAESLSLVTYVNELARRSQFSSQGEAVLALWREIAWTKAGSPKPKFRLRPDAILAAESAVREGLVKMATSA